MPENLKTDKLQTRKRDLVTKQIIMLLHYLIVVNAFISVLQRKECQNGKINRKLMKATPKYFEVVPPIRIGNKDLFENVY